MLPRVIENTFANTVIPERALGVSYSRSSAALEQTLITEVGELSRLQASQPETTPALGGYLSILERRTAVSPGVFHEDLWKGISRARAELRQYHPSFALSLEATHNLLVRNSRTPAVLGSERWAAGSVEECAKIYRAGNLPRAAIGLSESGPFLWQAPSVLLALAPGTEPTPHAHTQACETGLSFGRGTRLHRAIGTTDERVDVSQPGTFSVVPPNELHRVDSADALAASSCIGFTVAFPSSALDRSSSGVTSETPVFLTSSGFDPITGISWNFLHQAGEGSFLQPHITFEVGSGVAVGAFDIRAPRTAIATILHGGVFEVRRSDGRVHELKGDAVVLSAGYSFEIYCRQRYSPDIPPQVGMAIALPSCTGLTEIGDLHLNKELRRIEPA
jgi:hypothetical protein